jgi:hypothetical protein
MIRFQARKWSTEQLRKQYDSNFNYLYFTFLKQLLFYFLGFLFCFVFFIVAVFPFVLSYNLFPALSRSARRLEVRDNGPYKETLVVNCPNFPTFKMNTWPQM